VVHYVEPPHAWASEAEVSVMDSSCRMEAIQIQHIAQEFWVSVSSQEFAYWEGLILGQAAEEAPVRRVAPKPSLVHSRRILCGKWVYLNSRTMPAFVFGGGRKTSSQVKKMPIHSVRSLAQWHLQQEMDRSFRRRLLRHNNQALKQGLNLSPGALLELYQGCQVRVFLSSRYAEDPQGALYLSSEPHALFLYQNLQKEAP